MQSNLKALFAGKREAAELPPKRGPGRPPKQKNEEEEEKPDVLVEALREIPAQAEAYDERLHQWRRKRKLGESFDESLQDDVATALVEAAGASSVAELRIPGARRRDSAREGASGKAAVVQVDEESP